MVDVKTLRKAQLKMLEILDEIDRICIKHNIQYWISYGTLLGAVRHQGFIPWDDDCDICIMRKDYEKFMEVAPKELSKNLLLQNNKLDPNYPKTMTKVRMRNTKFVEFHESDNEKYFQGIFVDIFIFDYYPSYIAYIINNIQFIERWRRKRHNYPKGDVRRIAIQLLVGPLYLFYSLTEKILKKISALYKNNDKCKYVGKEVSDWNRIFHMKNDVFPIVKKHDFEGKIYAEPNNPDKFLKDIYGNYMILPRAENRHWHAKKIEL